MNQKQKLDLVSILSVILIIIGLFLIIFISIKLKSVNNQKQLSSKIKNDNGTVDLIDSDKKYCLYAQKTLNWMDKKRDDSGKYYEAILCDTDNEVCNNYIKSGQSGHDAIISLWARYKNYLKSNDANELTILKKDIDIYYKQLEIMPIQNDSWNCKLLLEMLDEKNLGQDYISKISKLCQSSLYFLTNNINGDYNDKNIFEYKTSNLPYYDWKNPDNQKLSKIQQLFNIASDYCSICVSYPSDLVATYNKWGNQTDLKVANSYFNELLVQYYLNQDSFQIKDKCLMATSSLDLYTVNNDQRYLDWSKEIYNNYFFNQQIKPEAMIPECAYLNREIAKIDNSIDYKYYESKLLDKFISQGWDGTGGESITGEGGFFNVYGNFRPVKTIKENALIVNLLCP